MASKPPDLPESITLDKFLGVRNTVSRERLAPGELEAAVNVDIDDAGQLRSRRGKTRKAIGNYHSLWSSGARMFCVKDGHLGRLYPDYTHASIVQVDKDFLAYAEIGDTIFYASKSTTGKILSNDSRVEWGSYGEDNQWLSPVVRPTGTLGAIRGKLLGPPPNATALAAWNGRVYLAHERVLWATELFMPDLIDRTRNFLWFEDDITTLSAVDGGLYVGTKGGLKYLSGNFSQGLKTKDITASPVIAGSAVEVPQDQVIVPGMGPLPVGQAVMLMTTDGILFCRSDGEVHDMTRGKVAFPAAEVAAALYRDDSGVSSYAAVTSSGGDRMANARVGDYCDAEIRRFQGG